MKTVELLSPTALANIMADENRTKFDPKEVRLSAVGLCARRQFFSSREGVPPIEWEYDQYGHYLQALVAKALKRQGRLVAEEVEVLHPYGVGHIDIVIWYNDEKRSIVEVKSTKCSGLKYDLPKEYHVLQVKAQMMFSKIKHAEIVYLCREHAGKHNLAFAIEFPNEKEQKTILDKLSLVADSIRMGYAADVPFDKPEWECSYKTYDGDELKEIRCPFYDRCWSPKEPVKALAPTDDKAIAMVSKFGQFFEAWQVSKENFESFDKQKKNLERKLVEVIGDFELIENEKFSIKRTQVNRNTLDYKGFVESQGLEVPEEFMKVTVYDRFSVRLKGESNEQNNAM